MGLPDPDADEIRSDGDEDFVRGVCVTLDIDFDSVEDVFRDGQMKLDRQNYCRIVKVKFVDSASRMVFLKKFRAGKPTDGVYRRTYVRPDMTFRQRQVDKQLSTELNIRRQQDPNLIIRNGQIVPRRTYGGHAPFRGP